MLYSISLSSGGTNFNVKYKTMQKVHHSKDTFWDNFIVTDLLKIEPLQRIKCCGGVLNFLDVGECVLKINVFRLERL